MPTKSAAQERLMQGVAHNPEFAEKVGIPQSVGKEFVDDAAGDETRYKNHVIRESKLMGATEFHVFGLSRSGGGRKHLGKASTLDDAKRMVENLSAKTDEDFHEVGEFVESPAELPIDPKAGPAGRAAGILFLTADGETLLMRRGDGGDFPFTWGLPGGHLEHGEDAEEAARREAEEETGLKYKDPLTKIYDDGQFVTYLAKIKDKFDVTLCNESTGYAWCKPENAPQPLHPGLRIAFRVASAHTELDIAKLISEGILSSPQIFANMHLLALRITGTGLAYRSSIGEHVWRDASLYLNEEFLQRCNGLTVIMDHPDNSILDSKEFKNRAIGSVMLPYLKGDEVWGIAKIYDDAAMEEILEGDISTSPSVVFDESAGNTTLTTESGEPLLIEGRAFLLDHIAIVTKERGSRGVWDKGGSPQGVELNNPEVVDMTDKIEAKVDASGDKLDALLSAIGTLVSRMDSMEKNLPEKPLAYAADKKRKDEDEPAEMMMDDEKAKDDAEGSDPKEHGKAGEMKPDADEPEEFAAKKDDDEEDDKVAAKMDAASAMFADTQAKADSIFAAFGKAASRPLQGEGLTSYRKRLLRGLQGYSDSYKSVNLKSISDKALLEIAEKQIFADALRAAKNPVAYGDALVEHRTTDRTGRVISTFTGSVSAWLDDFKVPPMRATEFRVPNVTNYR